MQYIEVGSTPCMEDSAQIKHDDYPERSRLECRTYIKQLERSFPIPEALFGECRYAMKSFEHDMGTYREVVIYYNPTHAEAVDHVYRVENNLPECWDDEARIELGLVEAKRGA